MSRRILASPDQATFDFAAETEPMPPTTEPGIAVPIQYRAVHLLKTLELIGQERSLGGFDTASTPGSTHEPEILDRYGEATPFIRSKAAEKREGLHAAAKWEYARATGHLALRDAASIDHNKLNRETAAEFDEFIERQFTGIHALRTRSRLRRALHRQR